LNSLIIVQALQTLALVAVAVAVIYTLLLLRGELKGAAATLRQVIDGQNQLQENVRRSWERIDAIEARLTRLEPRRPPGPSP
jgi:hypothetical protein